MCVCVYYELHETPGPFTLLIITARFQEYYYVKDTVSGKGRLYCSVKGHHTNN